MSESPLRTFLRLIWLLVATPSVLLALLLFFSSVTFSGRLMAVGVLVLCVFPGFAFSERVWKPVAPMIGILGCCLIILVWVLGPSGKNSDDAAFQSIYDGSARFNAASPAQLVPEIDQHLMGSHVFAFADPYIDRKKGRRIRRVIRDVYEPMDKDPEFRNAGCALGQCYQEMFGGGISTGHLYVYKPPDLSKDQQLPVILFLHGSLGNFKGYMWCWKSFADRNGFIVVAPSYGVGEWRQESGLKAISHGLEFIDARDDVDEERIYISGVSNGGFGVTRALQNFPDRFCGAIAISPVLEPGLTAKAAGETPFLVISGEDDLRVPARALALIVEEIKNAETDFVPDEDHFLLFSDSERIWRTTENWIVSSR